MMKTINAFLIGLAMIFSSAIYGKNIVLTSTNMLSLSTDFNSESCGKVMAAAMDLALHPMNFRIGEKIDLYLVIFSPGGSVNAGTQMFDVLNGIMDVRIHTVVIEGYSMGFIAPQFLGERYILRHGTLMSHKASGGIRGEMPGQLDSRYRYWLNRIVMIEKQVVKRTKGKHTLESYRKLMENEYWCTGQECVDQGFADAVVNASCDASLSGNTTKSRNYKFLGRSIKIEESRWNCPLISGSAGGRAMIDGIRYNFDSIKINNFLKSKLGERRYESFYNSRSQE